MHDKIMILGTGFLVRSDGKAVPTRRGEERLDRALEHYYALGTKAMLLCAGGYSGAIAQKMGVPAKHREAYVMAEYLMSEGDVPASAILLEPNSTSTVTNFTYSLRDGLLKHDDELAVVTHPYHMNRAGLIADKLDLAMQAVPTDERDNECLERRLYALYTVALAGARGIAQVEWRERTLATTLNRLRN